MEFEDTKYFTVQSWMVNKLNLKTVERDVFAIIYGFCQDNATIFYGTLSYVSFMTGYSRNSICAALKGLVEKNLINKLEDNTGNIKSCGYTINMDTVQATCTGVQATCTGVQATCTQTVQATCTGVQATCTNNINNNKNSNNKIINKNNTKFLQPAVKQPKTNLYSNCINLIDEFITLNHCSMEIRSLLINHLDLMCEQKKLKGKNQYKGILNKLQLAHQNGTSYNEIIRYSIEHGYATFYECNNNSTSKSTKAVSTESGARHVPTFTEDDKIQMEKFQEQLKQDGKRTQF